MKDHHRRQRGRPAARTSPATHQRRGGVPRRLSWEGWPRPLPLRPLFSKNGYCGCAFGQWCSPSESEAVEQSPKNNSVTSHRQDGWTKFNVYKTGADYFAHVHFTCLNRTSVILLQVVITCLCILDSDFYNLYSFKTNSTETCVFYRAKNQ